MLLYITNKFISIVELLTFNYMLVAIYIWHKTSWNIKKNQPNVIVVILLILSMSLVMHYNKFMSIYNYKIWQYMKLVEIIEDITYYTSLQYKLPLIFI